MTYQNKLSPWTIVRLQPNLNHIPIGRFRHRHDAEGRLRVLKQMVPQSQFAIVFDCNNDAAEPSSVSP
jgi:hypothetical protein